MKQALVALGAALALMSGTAHAAITQAQTTAGAVRGEAINGIGEFKGIPFAAAPVGDLRWKAPQPIAPWQGVRQTVAFGPACMQGPILAQMGSTAAQSEDCLYVDVWTPAHTPAEAARVRAVLTHDQYEFTAEVGSEATFSVRGTAVTVRCGEPSVVVPLDGQGPRIDAEKAFTTRGRREDGSLITASVPRSGRA